jgi:hypothetical protein
MMAYESFETWFDAVQSLMPVPVAPDDRWYDAYLSIMDPHEAIGIVKPVQVQGRLRALWNAIKLFFD